MNWHGAAKSRVRLVVAMSLLALVALTGCVQLSTPDDGGASDFPLDPVFLLGTELLDPPAVAGAKAFKAAVFSEIDPSNPALGDAAGFFLTVSARSPESLQIRVAGDGATGVLQSAPAPTGDADRALAQIPAAYDEFVQGTLSEGRGVFWIAESQVDGHPLAHRIGCLIPTASLSPITRVSVFATKVSGIPTGGFEFELVGDFMYVAVIGDSIQWGNGLNEKDKMRSLIGATLERALGRKVITQVYANSGARIVPADGDGVCALDCFGEAPVVSTSVLTQLDLIERGDLIELVMMDGCINDVGVEEIINPLADQEKLVADTAQFCDTEMTTLLRKVRDRVPNAMVIVTGYFQIVSQYSDLVGVRSWSSLNENQAEIEELIAVLTENSILFRDTAHTGLAAAVATVNEETGETKIAFADPEFGPENAVFAKDKWLWSMSNQGSLVDLDLELTLFPEDPIFAARQTACASPFFEGGLIGCLYASVGHPNPSGERAYVEAVINHLRDLGLLLP